MFLLNLMTVTQNFPGLALSMILLCPFMGMNGVWISVFTGKLLDTFLLFVFISIRCRRVAVRLTDYMYLPESFNAEIEDEIGISITTMDEVLGMSEDAIAFCRKHGIDEEKSLFAGLSIEEMSAIIAEKGFHDGEKLYIDIRILLKEKDLSYINALRLNNMIIKLER